ncbi:uncharacterized protein [Montipora capricornis]|uniref:uncharacterized protein isoform X1 n=1 Tax=Montipora capricornis TaxID=246305 RepID=UPI0035F1D7D7
MVCRVFLRTLCLTVFISSGITMSSSSDDLKAVFSMGGIKGSVIFSQPQNNGSTIISVNLLGVNETLTWSIQQLPMIYYGNAVLSCSAIAVGGLFDPKKAKKAADYNTHCRFESNTKFHRCAVGDLSRMLGNITARTAHRNHTNQSLATPTRGPHSIMGRTLVLYSGVTPKACALIAPLHPMKTAVAIFRAPVAGYVFLRQVEGMADTSIFVDLFFVNNAESRKNFTWQINEGVADTDASDNKTYCKTLGELFDPENSQDENCNEEMHENCSIGNLASKHGTITISLASTRRSSTKAAFTDSNLPLTGPNSVIGKSIVLFPVNNPGKPIACAKIVTLMTQVAKATFKAEINAGVTGYFKFTQASPFDPTLAEIHLNGIQSKAHGYHVHVYPSPAYKNLSPSDSCQGFVTGGHWNPFNIDIKTSPAEGTGTLDEYEVGDLSGKYGSFLNLTSYEKKHIDYNLPLFGPNSIQGRSVVLHKHKIKEKNKRWVCSNLKPELDPNTYFFMKASANFTGPTLKGMIFMGQYLPTEANVAAPESSIYIDVMYVDPKTPSSESHKWDIHLDPVGDDATAPDLKERCRSLQEDFNPFGVYGEGTYSSACSPTNMLRCEIGDLTQKHAPINVGGGRQFYNDVNLPLFGRNSVVGRGITVHEKHMQQRRVACANIVADSSLFVDRSLVFVKQDPFSSAHFVNVVAKALGIPKWRLFNIRTEGSEIDKCQVAKFGIIGNADQVSQPVMKLSEVLSNNPGALDQYQPNEDCEPALQVAFISGTTRCRQWSISYLVMVAIVATVWR